MTNQTQEGNAVEAVEEAVKPWEFCDGEPPEYDNPLRCVFESGCMYAVNLLAKKLKVAHFEMCDGTEEFDGDLGGTLFNVVLAAMPKNADGDEMHPGEVRAAIAAMPSTPSDQEKLISELREALERARPFVSPQIFPGTAAQVRADIDALLTRTERTAS